MNYYLLDQRNFWCGIDYIDEPTENLFSYQNFFKSISPWQDANNPSKFKSINLNLPELDFFYVSSGKLPQDIYITGGYLPRGFIIKRNLYAKLIESINFGLLLTFSIASSTSD